MWVEFILQYWMEFLFGLLIAIMSAWIKSLQNKLKIKQVEQNAMRAGMIIVLRGQLSQMCNQYLELGYIPVQDSEDILNEAKEVYDAYHAIGGNGTGTKKYEKFLALEIRN